MCEYKIMRFGVRLGIGNLCKVPDSIRVYIYTHTCICTALVLWANHSTLKFVMRKRPQFYAKENEHGVF